MVTIILLWIVFYTSKANFYIDDTDVYQDMPEIVAAPYSFGYSVEEGNRIWPELIYPACHQINMNPFKQEGILTVNQTKRKAKLTWENGTGGYMFTGPPENITMSSSYDSKKWWDIIDFEKKGKKKVKLLPKTEFVFASCNSEPKGFEIMDYQPNFNETAYNRWLNYPSAQSKPMMIIQHTVDSFSRRHFFRKMNQTVELMNVLEKSPQYSIFDFKLHNIIGADTIENQSTIFADEWVKKISGSKNIDAYGDRAMWNIVKNKGFMTLLGFDAWSINVPRTLGRRPMADHVVYMFYCAATIHGGYRPYKTQTSYQRCIGDKMAHGWLMDYSRDFSSMYSNTSQWIYNHFTAAHEETGQHAQTLDYDLYDQIYHYLTTYSESHNIIIFLVGDHGMRYGDFVSDISAIQEYRIPIFFLIMSNRLMTELGVEKETLEWNSLRFTTKPDIRETIHALVDWQAGLPHTKDDPAYYDFLKEKIPNDRRCEDAKVPLWYWGSHGFYVIPEKMYQDPIKHPKMYNMIHELTNQVVLQVNEYVYTTYVLNPQWLCQKLTLNNIETASFYDYNNDVSIYKIIFTVKESDQAELDAWVYISPEPLKDAEFKHENYPPIPWRHEGKKMFLRVLFVERTDKYAGPCEPKARKFGLNPKLCICYDDDVKYKWIKQRLKNK